MTARVLCIIPAYNEADSLPAVVNGLRLDRPDLDIVVIDDGSTDRTSLVTDDLDVCVIRFSERLGIGNALRAGLRYAARMGYAAAVRLDGDGQHRARDIDRLTSPILEGRADVVIGSRYTSPAADELGSAGLLRVLQRLLAVLLSALTGRRVTDPTSGFCAFGRRAIRLLAEHHPTGYPEPELVLLLSRSGLTTIETSVEKGPRLGGCTSLTPRRVAGAVARVMLAMLIVPLRRPSEEATGE